MPNASATGTISGIRINAFAEPDAIKKLSTNTIKYTNKITQMIYSIYILVHY